MYQRISLGPVFRQYWSTTFFVKDRSGKESCMTFDLIAFYGAPVLIAGAAAVFSEGYSEVCDFVLKFSILLMPLMLNLFFHVVRLIQDDRKLVASERKSIDGPEPELLEQASLKAEAMNQLAVNILYSASLCFLSAVLAGLASFKTIWAWTAAWNAPWLSTALGYIGRLVVYSVAIHLFLVGLQILRRTHNIISYMIR